MSPDTPFDKLVKELDDAALRGLTQAIAREAGQRRLETSIQMEQIRPDMSAEDKARATERIAHVLRGEE
jgi:hypothetical protein